SKVTWAWNAVRLGPVNLRAASLNDAITSSVRTFIIPSLGPALESETTTEGSRTENSNHDETILRGFPERAVLIGGFDGQGHDWHPRSAWGPMTWPLYRRD